MAVGAAAAARRLLRGLLRLLPLLWCCVPPADFLIVEVEEKNQIVLLNDNVTISCKVPGSTPLDINKSGIIWYQKHQANETEHEVFVMFGNHQKTFRPGASVSLAGLEKGDVSLHLPVIQWSDAGEYRCKVVVTPDEAQETIFLNVLASLKCTLFQEQAMMRDDGDKYILCKAHGFYPEDIIITWHTWTQENPQGQEISEGVTTGPAIKNEDGTFNITSRVRLEPNVTAYQCVISHRSLRTPCRLNFTQFRRASLKCTLFQEQAMMRDDGDKYILCKAHGFYPEDIIITWHTWTQENSQGQEISEGVTTGLAIKNEDGTFNITSRVRLEPNVTTYQCVISHRSLRTLCRLNFTQFRRGSGMGNTCGTLITIIGCIVAAAVIIGLINYCKKRKLLLRRHDHYHKKRLKNWNLILSLRCLYDVFRWRSSV